jgi:hypothetical protein
MLHVSNHHMARQEHLMPHVLTDASHTVFVSYASVDRERVQQIVDAFEANGIRCWLDQRSFDGGDSYGPAIASAIRASRVVVVMCSSASLASRNVRQELAIAWKHQRPLLPLLLEPMTVFPTDAEYWLESAQ